MSESDDQRDSVVVQYGDKSIRLRRYDTVVGIVFVAACAFLGAYGWAFWEHTVDTKEVRMEEIRSRAETAAELSAAIREIANSQRDLAYAVRLQTCIQALPQDAKLEQIIKENSYCNRVTK